MCIFSLSVILSDSCIAAWARNLCSNWMQVPDLQQRPLTNEPVRCWATNNSEDLYDMTRMCVDLRIICTPWQVLITCLIFNQEYHSIVKNIIAKSPGYYDVSDRTNALIFSVEGVYKMQKNCKLFTCTQYLTNDKSDKMWCSNEGKGI